MHFQRVSPIGVVRIGCRATYFRDLGTFTGVTKMAHANVIPWKYIDASRVKQVLKYEDLIPVIEEALKNFSAREKGGIVQPVRATVEVEDRG